MRNKIKLEWKSMIDGTVTETINLYEYDNYIVENVEKGYAIVKYTGDESDTIIPEYIGGLPVVRLGNDDNRLPGRYTFVFDENKKIKKIKIPASITEIKTFALQSCYTEAFYVHENNKNYSSRNGVLFDKQKKELIRYPAGRIKRDYIVPESIEKIGQNAFRGCESLENILLPGELKEIGWDAFSHCASLKKISIPDSITIIDWNCFEQCEKLETVIIPNSVTEIGVHAFDGCKNLTHISIPASVIEIGGHAFAGCNSLEQVEFPSSVVKLDRGVFSGCCNLKSFSITEDNNIFTVDNGVLFNENKTILIQYPAGKDTKKYVVPDSVAEIEDSAFYGCNKLTEITIPDNVIKIGWSAFIDCKKLTDINIPKNVDLGGYNPFSGCKSLKNIIVDADDCNFAIEDGVLFNKDMSKLICYPGGLKRDEYTIPDGVTRIVPMAFEFFAGCLTLPNSMTKVIGGGIMTGNVFRLCHGIKKIVLPSNITEIEELAFIQCDGLETIDIHSKKENIKIGEAAFHNKTVINFVNG